MDPPELAWMSVRRGIIFWGRTFGEGRGVYSWQWKSSRTRQQSYRPESFAMKTDPHTFGSMVKKPHLIKNGIRIQCNTENFVSIVVPGLSTSSSSSLPSSTSMTPSRQEIHHPTSPSSSSTSPTMTVSSDSETRAGEDLSGIDSHPVLVSSSHVERNRTGWPVVDQANRKSKTKIKRKPRFRKGETRCFQRYWNGCKSSENISWMIEFLNAETHTPVLFINPLYNLRLREVWIWVNSVFYTQFP